MNGMRYILVLAKYAILLVVPLVGTVAALLMQKAMTPYFMFHHDPEYAYLFNGVSILHLLAPSHIDHPGTPLQLLCAAVIKLMHPFSSNKEIVEYVLENPEKYLQLTNLALIGINTIALIVVGIITYRFTQKIWLGVLMQSPPLLFDITIISLGQVTPEPLGLAVSLLFACLLLLSLGRHEQLKINPEKVPRYFGLVSGFGVAVKLTFAPILLAAPFVFQKIQHLKSYAKYILLGFFLSTLPLLLEFPPFVKYGEIIAWAYNLFAGAGIYGQGEHTIINADRFLFDLWHIILAQPLYSLIVLVAGFTIVYGLLKLGWRNAWANPSFRLLTGLVLVHTIMLVLVGKHPQSDRYLVPVMGLVGLTLLLVSMFLSEQIGQFDNTKLLRQVFAVCAVMVIAVFGVFQANTTIVNTAHQRSTKYKELSDLSTAVANRYSQCAQVHQDDGTKTFALFFGLQWSRKSEVTKHVVEQFFAGKKMYTHDPNNYYDMNTKVVSLDEIRKSSSCVIWLGPGTQLRMLWP